jgi:hypothetical protein
MKIETRGEGGDQESETKKGEEKVKWTLEFRLMAYECISCVLPWTKFRLIAYECISCVLPWTKFRRRRT